MVVDTKLYDVLTVAPDASTNDIIQAGRKLSRQWHPDKNAHQIELAEQKFKEIRQALEILSDEGKRKTYDQFGVNADGPSSSSGEGPFGGGFPFGGGPFGGFGFAPRGPRPMEVAIQVSLEQIARQDTITIPFPRQVECIECDGRGSTNKHARINEPCKPCSGQGVVNQQVQIAPNMFQHVQRACPACRGLGKHIPLEDQCRSCEGKGKRQVTVRAPFPLKNRMVPCTAIPFTHDGVSLTVTLRETTHEVFQRDPRRPFDLHVTLVLNLHEALFGFTKQLHLPDRRIAEVRFVGKTDFGSKRKVVNGGLGDEGNLIITFEFELPSVSSVAHLLRRFQEMKEEEKLVVPNDEVVGMAMVDFDDEEDGRSPPQHPQGHPQHPQGNPQECRTM